MLNTKINKTYRHQTSTDMGSFSWTFVVWFSVHVWISSPFSERAHYSTGSGALFGMCWIAEWATYSNTMSQCQCHNITM